MKKIMLALFLVGTVASVAQATEKKVVMSTQVSEDLTVTAIPGQGPDEYLITCTSPEDGVGVLQIIDLDENIVMLWQQIAIVNGQY